MTADPRNVEAILSDITDAEEFSFNNMRKKAKIISVYDADTVDAILCVRDRPYKFKIRLNGIDTPEIRPLKTMPNRDIHVECGIKCREYLKSKILNKIVEVQCSEFDKYGRILGEIIFDNKNISEHLISKKYAKKYEGKTKIQWTLDELNYIKNN
jgi:endonuclease YncB( thermonuclease family)